MNGFPYIVNGAGGAGLYTFNSSPIPESIVRYNALHGAHAAWPVENADAHLSPGRDPQDVEKMSGARIRECDVAGVADFAGLEDDQIHENDRRSS